MWMMIVGAWIVSLVAVAFFVAGSKRHGDDANEPNDVDLDRTLARLGDDGRKSDIYYVGDSAREKSSSHKDANVA